MESAQETQNSQLLPGNNKYAGFMFWFVAALLIRLWFNFCTIHPDALGAADASEYLRYATAISKLNLAAPVFGPEWKEFAISGPAFPFFLLLCSLFSFSHFNADSSHIFLIGQSLVSALTVGFIAQISRRLWNENTACWAGGLAAIYPGFVVNSGRLYSETFATFLEMAAIAIFINFILKKNSSPLLLTLLGSLLIALQLTRSSMILLSGLLFSLVFALAFQGKLANWKKALFSASSVILGMVMVLAPWLLFQKNAFNKMTPIVDRVGHYNLFVGTNTDTQGFLTYPYPDGSGIEEKSFLQLTLEAYRKSPSRFIKLALDKPARLYKFPWNDFRTSIGPIPFHSQVLIHQTIALLALFGLCLGVSLYSEPATVDDQKRRVLIARYSLLLIVLLNLPYLAFITVPRYNLLAMPAIIILAAAGITTMVNLLKTVPLSKAPKIAALAALFLIIYLRDEVRSTFSFGAVETSSLYIVQGADQLTRSIAAGLGTIALFTGIFYSIKLLNGARATAMAMTIVTGLSCLLLCTWPQRANGRIGEGIVTLARAGEKLNGQIFIPSNKLKSDGNSQWFVLIDSDKGQLLKNQFVITINGIKLQTPAISGIQALDDWHHLKNNADKTSYLDCAYIFDCLAQPSSISNSDLRQWFIIPVESGQIVKTANQGYIDITLEQKSQESSTFFSAAPTHKHDRSQRASMIPATAVYSWEKAFYGVENDAGFTDSRLDEVVTERKSKWTISYQGSSEELHADINVRLLKVSGTETSKNDSVQASGDGEAVLAIPAAVAQGYRQLLTVSTKFAQVKATARPVFLDTTPASPKFHISFTDNTGVRRQLPLVGLPHSTDEKLAQSMSFVVDLAPINGSDYQLHGKYHDKSCQFSLLANSLNCHPLFSQHEIF